MDGTSLDRHLVRQRNEDLLPEVRTTRLGWTAAGESPPLLRRTLRLPIRGFRPAPARDAPVERTAF